MLSSPLSLCALQSRNALGSIRRFVGKSTFKPAQTHFKLSDIGEGITEVEILQWYIKKGTILTQFDRVCEVQSDKATVEITSRYDGEVLDIFGDGEVGKMVKVGESLCVIEVDSDGDESNDSVLSSSDGADAKLSIPQKQRARPKESSQTSVASDKKVQTTPAVRKIAAENSVNLQDVTGTGPKGRILKEDLLHLITVDDVGSSNQKQVPPRPLPSSPPPPPLQRTAPTTNSTTTISLSGYTRMMHRTMTASLQIPHFMYSDEMDLTTLDRLRSTLRQPDENGGESKKLTYMPFIIKAFSMSLLSYPILNSSLTPDGNSITLHNNHNIGIAMDTPKGLIVPNIKNVQNLSIFEISNELKRLKASSQLNGGTFSNSDLMGTTVSLSNIGSIGGTYMSPVLSGEQVAIMAVGSVRVLPRFNSKGDVEAVSICNLSFAGDHRVLDGATMARFGNCFRKILEDEGGFVGSLR